MSKELKDRALRLVLNCVRNTSLEDLHAGTVPTSQVGDYSDVKVVGPHGEIPWNNLSRISDEEMKKLMIEVVDKVYSFFLYDDQLRKSRFFSTPKEWNEPQIDAGFAKLAARIEADEKDSSPSPWTHLKSE